MEIHKLFSMLMKGRNGKQFTQEEALVMRGSLVPLSK